MSNLFSRRSSTPLRHRRSIKRPDPSMAITIKNEREIELMRQAGHIVGLAHARVQPAIVPGVTTKELDEIVREVIEENGATPTFLGHLGFTGRICASINEEIVHGIPGKKTLQRWRHYLDRYRRNVWRIHRRFRLDLPGRDDRCRVSTTSRRHRTIALSRTRTGSCWQSPRRYRPGDRDLRHQPGIWHGS